MSWRAWLNSPSSGANSQDNSGSNKVIGGRVTKPVRAASGNTVKGEEVKQRALFSSDSDSEADQWSLRDPLKPTRREIARVHRRLNQTDEETQREIDAEFAKRDAKILGEYSQASVGLAKSTIAGGGGEDDEVGGGQDNGEDAEDVEDTEGSSSELSEPIDILVPDVQELKEAYDRIARGAVKVSSSKESTSEDYTPSLSELSSLSGPENIGPGRPVPPNYDPEDNWRYEQIYLNQILKARDEYSLMPTTWRMHFRGVPLPDGLFYVQTQRRSTRPRIYAHSDRFEYRGAKILRRLMQLHQRIREYRKLQATNPTPEHNYVYTLGGRMRKELVNALRWAEHDGDTARFSNDFPPNIQILEMGDEDRLEMDLHIQQGMSNRAERWREILGTIPEDRRPLTPVLFSFVIFKHILFIVTLDAQNPDAVCHIPIQLNLSERNQSQWNALAIMVTICWARDLLSSLFGELKKLAGIDNVGPDPNGNANESDPDA